MLFKELFNLITDREDIVITDDMFPRSKEQLKDSELLDKQIEFIETTVQGCICVKLKDD